MGQPAFTILVTGLGALGTVFATFLKGTGHAVYALARERYLHELSGGKLHVSGIWGDHEAVLDGIFSTVDPLKEKKIDLVILTVKSFDTAGAIEQVKALVGKDTLVVCAQNGYGNYERVSEVVGPDHTLLARIIFGAKLSAPGRAEVTVIADAVRIGQPDGRVEAERIKEIARAFSEAGIPTEYAENITAILWDKILYNVALNPLGAILECTYGQLAESKDTREMMNQILDEIFAVAQAHQIQLNWKSAEDYKNYFYTKLVPPTAKHFPSMYYDVKAGKKLEIDALNGAVVRLAKVKGLAVPVNETITGIIKAKEALAKSRK